MIKFHYFGDTSKAYTNVITIASQFNPETNKVVFGVSFSNRCDRYLKCKGKHIALTRYTNSPIYASVAISTFNGIIAAIADVIRQDPQTPGWAHDIFADFQGRNKNLPVGEVPAE